MTHSSRPGNTGETGRRQADREYLSSDWRGAPPTRLGAFDAALPALMALGQVALADGSAVTAAAALFAERGYAGTTTRAVAERVGIRQASLYHHFAGKDEILLELLETSVRPSLEFVARQLDASDPVRALRALAERDVATLLATPHNIRSLYLAHEVQEPRFESFREHRAQLQRAYVHLAAAIAPGSDAAFLGACCMQLVEMVIPMRRAGEPPAETAASIAAACLRVVGA